MPALYYRALDREQRREYKQIKRKIQRYLLLAAFVIAILISFYSRIFNAKDIDGDNNLYHSHPRQLLNEKDQDDGYYIDSLDEFPPLAFSAQTILDGAWVLYLFGMFYCFVGIGIICDSYFVPAIEVIVDRLQMSEDTAGATWMAAGGSAPELFTSFVGTFLAKSDVGFGTIVGSAVFNVLFIVGACAIFTSGTLKLQWYPFARDMCYYLISLGVLAFFFGGISKHQMYWYENVVLLCMYLLYVCIMKNNERIKAWVYKHFVYTDMEREKLLKKEQDETAYDANISMQIKRKDPDDEKDDFEQNGASNGCHNGQTPNGQTPTAGGDADDAEAEGVDLSFPDTCGARIWYIVQMPLTYPIYITLFDVSKEKYVDWWPWTFAMCLVWLGGLAYCMVYMTVVVGWAWSIPQELMGLVFLAAGTSVPELFSCIIVAKKGQADMAVSASIGSNIFDILVGLPLPWLSFCIVYGRSFGDLVINVEAHGLFLSILVLIVMLTCVLGIILVNKWVLTHCMGYSMIVLYMIFVGQDLMRHYYMDIQF